MFCKICNSDTTNIFSSIILNKYDIKYFHCPNCNFLQTEEPYWLAESYNNSIAIGDTGILQRNLHLSKIISSVLFSFFDKNGKYLDFAGGYGLFARLMRDIGFDFYWNDLYTQNIFAKGFEFNKNIKNIELITAFESFEHFANPLAEIEEILKISKNILFTTEFPPNPVPKPGDWWYYGLDHGQHISFFSYKTLEFIAKKFGLNFYSCKNIHLFTLNEIDNSSFENICNSLDQNLFSEVRKEMNSKTVDDMKLLISQINKRCQS